MADVRTFTHKKFGDIRTVFIKGEIYFVGKDIVGALGYRRPDHAISNLVDDEDKLMYQIDTSGQSRQMYVINESGVYSLIISSKLKKAKEFKHWVTSEVLPQIRKTGAYGTPRYGYRIETTAWDISPTPSYFHPYYYERIEDLKDQDSVSVSDIANDYGLSAEAFNLILRDLGIQFKRNGVWELYPEYRDRGFTIDAKCRRVTTEDDIVYIPYMRWTKLGLRFLYERIKTRFIIPIVDRPKLVPLYSDESWEEDDGWGDSLLEMQ